MNSFPAYGQANLPPDSTKQEILLDNLAPIGVPDLAFGNSELGSIHGNKFTDVNGNGVQDAGDLGRNGVTFTLTGVDNTGAAITPISVISGDDPSTPEVEVGEFWFTDLSPGTYTVTETVPTGFIATTPIAVSNIVLTSGVEFVSRVGQANLPPGSTKQEILLDNLAPIGVPDLAFGNSELGSIHGNKFTDVNGNGVQDVGDLGRNGVTFTLTGVDNTGAAITPISVISGDDPSTPEVEVGEFWFTDLSPGTYTVTETVPTGFIATTPIAVSNIVLTSGVEFVSRIGQANLPPDSTKQEILLDNLDPIGVPDLAFGNSELGSIHGNKFTDVNGNGVQDAGDLGRNGVTFTLTGIDNTGAEITPISVISGDNPNTPEVEVGDFLVHRFVAGNLYGDRNGSTRLRRHDTNRCEQHCVDQRR